MSELTQAQLLELVNTRKIAPGNARVRQLTERIVTDLFKTIDELDVTPDEFWAAAGWLTRLGAAGQTGLITAGLCFDRLLDIRADEADAKAGRTGGTPRAIEGPLFVAGAPMSQVEVRLDEGEPKGEVFVMEGQVLDLNGQPVPHATVDVWHAHEPGGSSHFFPGMQPYALRPLIDTHSK